MTPGSWIVRMNYRNRSVFFAFLFVALGAHMMGKNYSGIVWLFLALQFLVYPHALYWRAKYARDAGHTELNHMLLDTLVFGVWAAVLEFPLWITFMLVMGATLNLAVFHGPKGIAMALVAMATGATAVIAATGFHASPLTSGPVTALSIACVFLYLMVVASGAYTRTLKLRETRLRLQASEQALKSANLILKQQLDEIHTLQIKLSEQANRDPLTGLYNRRYLDATMARELARGQREGQALSLIMIDIDHFKQVNDTYGHQAGDEVLKSLALMLQTRATDVACRYGGEEFILLFPSMPQVVAQERAELYRKTFEETVITFGDFRIQTTLSIGVATYPGHGLTPEALISRADQALYRAKSEGRNRVFLAE
jgi:diguanylate cyclase (GGDEF)-like protein